MEIGCAAGSFTYQLASICERLSVVDVMPLALERCKNRLHNFSNVQYINADISKHNEPSQSFDLIVIAEVLYFLEYLDAIESIKKIMDWVKVGGTVIFCSVIDNVVDSWGVTSGAESCMKEWDKKLIEVERINCIGQLPDEKSLIVKYVRKN